MKGLTWPEKVSLAIAGSVVLAILGVSIYITGASESLGDVLTILFGILSALAIYAGVVWFRGMVERAAGIAEGGEETEEEDPSPTVPVYHNGNIEYVIERTNERTNARMGPERRANAWQGRGLSEQDKAVIRALYPGVSMARLAEAFNVSSSTIHKVIHEAGDDGE